MIFLTSLPLQIAEFAPHATAEAISDVGAPGFRSIVSPADLDGILVAYSNSLGRIYYLAAPFTALCWIAPWGMGWNDIRKKETGHPEAKANGTDGHRLTEKVKEAAGGKEVSS